MDWFLINDTLNLPWLGILYYLLVVFFIVRILLENRNPRETYSYILLLLLAPIVGLFIYLSFGQNYRRRKMFDRKKIYDNASFQKVANQLIDRFEEKVSLVAGSPVERLIQLLWNGNHALLSLSNKTDILVNGEMCFPSMLKAIEKSQHHIHLEYYIFSDDELGRQFTTLLEEKAKSGIEVRLIYDAAGSTDFSRRAIKQLRKAGAEVLPFLPVRFPHLANSLNYRNHRKILIVDGVIGYTGGINIDRKYDNRIANKIFWRDTHLRVEGAAVCNLQLTFLFDWYFCSNKEIDFTRNYFPAPVISASCPMQIVASGPDSDWPGILNAYLTALGMAKERIRITTPYFIPNDAMLSALKTAALGGVDVQLLVPYESDSLVVQLAVQSYYRELLEAGVQIFQYRKGFVHAKTMSVDGYIATIGTANLDFRSFDLNFEVNAFIYDEKIASELDAIFEDDKQACQALTLDELKSWGFWRRFGSSLARLLAPLL